MISFESLEDNLNICVTTKACSFGKTVVEKIEVNQNNKTIISLVIT